MPKSCQEICREMPQIPMFLDQHATLRTWLALAVRVGHRRLKVRVACGRVSILAAPFSRRCRRRRRPSASGPGRRRTSAAWNAPAIPHEPDWFMRQWCATRLLTRVVASVQEPNIQRKQDFQLLTLLLGLDCRVGFHWTFQVERCRVCIEMRWNLERALDQSPVCCTGNLNHVVERIVNLALLDALHFPKTPWCEFCKPSENCILYFPQWHCGTTPNNAGEFSS